MPQTQTQAITLCYINEIMGIHQKQPALLPERVSLTPALGGEPSAFSFLSNGFISHLSMSYGSFPCGAHSVFSFSRTDSLSEGEMWGALKPSLKWLKIGSVYKAADWIIWKGWWMLKTKQNKNLCTEWNHQCVSKCTTLSRQSLSSHQRKDQTSHCKVLEVCTQNKKTFE